MQGATAGNGRERRCRIDPEVWDGRAQASTLDGRQSSLFHCWCNLPQVQRRFDPQYAVAFIKAGHNLVAVARDIVPTICTETDYVLP